MTANHPAIPDSSICNAGLPVGQLTIDMEVIGDHGPAVVVGIEDSRWRFSMKPKRHLTFRDLASGNYYSGNYFPDAPLENNHEIHHANHIGSQRGYSTEQYQVLARDEKP